MDRTRISRQYCGYLHKQLPALGNRDANDVFDDNNSASDPLKQTNPNAVFRAHHTDPEASADPDFDANTAKDCSSASDVEHPVASEPTSVGDRTIGAGRDRGLARTVQWPPARRHGATVTAPDGARSKRSAATVQR